MKNKEQKYTGVRGLVEIVRKLRSEKGCPWDKKQTEETLKPFVIEEAYEVVDAISSGDKSEIMEELGDLLLQVVFLSEIYEERKEFSLDDVAMSINRKLLRRHPHVFDENFSLKEGECLEEVILKNWETIKAEEKKEKSKTGKGKTKSGIEGSSVYISESMPALHRAFMVQEKAGRTGFDFDGVDGAMDKIYEEISELKEELEKIRRNPGEKKTLEKIKEEYGDILFSSVNIGRLLNIHPCNALNQSSNKFIKRFSYIESRTGKKISELNPSKLNELWEESKQAS